MHHDELVKRFLGQLNQITPPKSFSLISSDVIYNLIKILVHLWTPLNCQNSVDCSLPNHSQTYLSLLCWLPFLHYSQCKFTW